LQQGHPEFFFSNRIMSKWNSINQIKKLYLENRLTHLNKTGQKKEERGWTCFWIDIRLVSTRSTYSFMLGRPSCELSASYFELAGGIDIHGESICKDFKIWVEHN